MDSENHAVTAATETNLGFATDSDGSNKGHNDQISDEEVSPDNGSLASDNDDHNCKTGMLDPLTEPMNLNGNVTSKIKPMNLNGTVTSKINSEKSMDSTFDGLMDNIGFGSWQILYFLATCMTRACRAIQYINTVFVNRTIEEDIYQVQEHCEHLSPYYASFVCGNTFSNEFENFGDK
ncbi:unnamed protein product, partial [Meganyctiphanes norvegica]